jgi:hypothetical protein
MICHGYIQADIAVNVGTLFYNCYYQVRGSENWKYFWHKGRTLFKDNVSITEAIWRRVKWENDQVC